MAPHARIAGIPGRRYPKRAPAIRLGRILTGAVPDHPAAVDYLATLGDWQMLGNDRAGDCVTPETRVLTADLRWVAAGDLVVGQKLLAFEEESRPASTPSGKRPGRSYAPAIVERTDRVVRPCYELEFDDGTVVRCSAGHRWLIGSLCNGAKWAETRNLKAGGHNASSVCKPLSVWDTDTSWEGGYLAGAFDSEGNLDQNVYDRPGKTSRSNRVAFSQVDNSVLAEVERCLKAIGFDYRHDVQSRGGNSCVDGASRQDIHRLTIGRRSEFLRFLGSVRPERILAKLDIGLLGRLERTNIARLVRKTYVGEQEVVMLDTSARTYFAEGLASHNCVAVTYANVRRLVTATLATENYPTQDQVWQVYRTQNPDFDPGGDPNVNGPGSPVDGGMDVQTLLEYLHKTGGPDGVKAVAFAAVDPRNADEVKAAIAIFGYVWTGITVTAANMNEFEAGQPWDYVPGSPSQGGHSIITAGYGPPAAGPLGGDERFITWASESSFTDRFWTHRVDECWVAIWPEHLGSKEFLAGVDLTALAADYQAVTGRQLPLPSPVPPSPTPGPAALAELGALVRKTWAEVMAWLDKHGL